MDEVTLQKKHAMVLLVQAIFDNLDELVTLRRHGRKGEITSTMLREMCSILRELDPELEKMYFEILTTLAPNRTITKKIPVNDEYIEAVVPAKRRLMDRIRSNLRNVA